MNNIIFATDIEAVLENGTEVKNVSGYIVTVSYTHLTLPTILLV